MRTLTEFVSDTTKTAAIVGTTTTVAAAIAGMAEGQSAAAPINAISHILWGDEAAGKDGLSLKYSAAGTALNGAAVAAWAGVYELLVGARVKEQGPVAPFAGGAAVAALAYVTDYHLVPRRLTPGFEKRLTTKSLFGIYATLAVGLGISGCLRQHR